MSQDQISLLGLRAFGRHGVLEHERAVAIFDLLEENSFAPTSGHDGPFHLNLGIEDNRLVLDLHGVDGAELERIMLPLAPGTHQLPPGRTAEPRPRRRR